MLLMLLLLAPVERAAAHDGGSHGRHGARPELGTGAAFDRQGRLWVVWKGRARGGPNLMLQSSADLGKTWTAPRPVLAVSEPVTAGGEARPRIAFGPQGAMYLSFTRTTARPHVGDIRFLRSLDGGRSFSAPTTVQGNRDAVTHSFESLLVDRAGRIYLAWIDGRDAGSAKAAGQPYAGSAIYYAVSEDGGASFKPDVKLADHACECCRIGLALDPQDNAMALWRHVFAPNVRDHALAALAANGKPAAPQRATFDDWRIDACPHHGPALAYGADGRRHQVWFDGGERGGVRYARTDANGKLAAPMALGGDQAEHADVAVQDSQVVVAWREYDGRSTAVRARLSLDDGASWRTLELARTGGDADKPLLLAGPPGIVLVWRTERDGIRVVPVTGERQ